MSIFRNLGRGPRYGFRCDDCGAAATGPDATLAKLPKGWGVVANTDPERHRCRTCLRKLLRVV